MSCDAVSSDISVSTDSSKLDDISGKKTEEVAPAVEKPKDDVPAAVKKEKKVRKAKVIDVEDEKKEDATPKKPKRIVGKAALDTLKLWREVCLETTGVAQVLRKTNPKYQEAKEKFLSKCAKVPKKEESSSSEQPITID